MQPLNPGTNYREFLRIRLYDPTGAGMNMIWLWFRNSRGTEDSYTIRNFFLLFRYV